MEIKVLGVPYIVRAGGGGLRVRLNVRMAVLIARLALEGSKAKWYLTQMVWPGKEESAIRTALSRLRTELKDAGIEYPFVCEGGNLALRDRSAVDVNALKNMSTSCNFARVVELTGRFLDVHIDEELGALRSWVEDKRRIISQWQRDALEREIARNKSERDLNTACRLAEQLIDVEERDKVEFRDEPYRMAMELFRQRGVLEHALKIHQQAAERCAREQPGLPLEEATDRLARDIDEELQALRDRASVVAPQLSAVPFCGRARELGELERAVREKKTIFLCGPSEVGKTRLMLELANRKGKYYLQEAHKPDAQVPLMGHLRVATSVLRWKPSLRQELPRWVKQALVAVLPDVDPTGALSPSPPDKIRFLQAAAKFFDKAFDGLELLLFDAAENIDSESLEIANYLYAEFRRDRQDGRSPVIINTFRTEAMSERLKEHIRLHVEAGLAVRIDIGPLDGDSTRELIKKMSQGTLGECEIERILEASGGVPGTIVQMVQQAMAAQAA